MNLRHPNHPCNRRHEQDAKVVKWVAVVSGALFGLCLIFGGF